MKIPNERDLLSPIRNAVTGLAWTRGPFITAISPLFEAFLQSGQEKDEYAGWCFNLTFLNKTIADQKPYHEALYANNPDWVFFPEGKDDCTYVIPGKGLIKIHLFSFLWNYGV